MEKGRKGESVRDCWPSEQPKLYPSRVALPCTPPPSLYSGLRPHQEHNKKRELANQGTACCTDSAGHTRGNHAAGALCGGLRLAHGDRLSLCLHSFCLPRSTRQPAKNNLPGADVPKAVLKSYFKFWCARSAVRRARRPVAALRVVGGSPGKGPRPAALKRCSKYAAHVHTYTGRPQTVCCRRWRFPPLSLACRWAGDLKSKNRQKVIFEILQGPLIGKAVTIPTMTGARARMALSMGGSATGRGAGGVAKGLLDRFNTPVTVRLLVPRMHAGPTRCTKTVAPAIATSYIGSQLFVFHKQVRGCSCFGWLLRSTVASGLGGLFWHTPRMAAGQCWGNFRTCALNPALSPADGCCWRGFLEPLGVCSRLPCAGTGALPRRFPDHDYAMPVAWC
jgi:hypothetical protein